MAEATGRGRVRSAQGMKWCGAVLAVVAVGAPVWLAAGTVGPGETDPPPPRSGADRQPPPDRATTRSERPGHDLDAIRSRWLGELHRLGGDIERAPRAVAALQKEAFRHHSLRGLDKLHRYQVSMASTLAARDRGCFRPMV